MLVFFNFYYLLSFLFKRSIFINTPLFHVSATPSRGEVDVDMEVENVTMFSSRIFCVDSETVRGMAVMNLVVVVSNALVIGMAGMVLIAIATVSMMET